MPHILVVNGPNLNLLGEREPEFYGHETLGDIEATLNAEAGKLGITLSFFQSNGEGELVTAIQDGRKTAHALIINPGAYAHTSVAIRDAVSIFKKPAVEVHLSNLHARPDEFRHQSYLSAVVTGVISGLGSDGYRLALLALAKKLG